MNHYEALGLPRTATANEIRSSFRKLAIKHHPDRSKDPKSVEVFKRASEAYEVLGDIQKRRSYDIELGARLRREAERARKANPFGVDAVAPTSSNPSRTTQPKKPRAAPTSRLVSEDVARLSLLFSRGRHVEAEELARTIVDRDPRQALPYAILGDIARTRGNRAEAAKMYAFAVQMDPRTRLYQERHEEMVKQIETLRQVNATTTRTNRIERLPFIGGAIILMALLTVFMESSNRPAFPRAEVLATSSWTLLVCLFVSGFAMGSCLSFSKWVDRLASILFTSTGRPSQVLGYSALALVNFWLAATVYGVAGTFRGTHTYSLSRSFAAIGIVTLAFAAAATQTEVRPSEILVWGGNFAFLGMLFGWLVTDLIDHPARSNHK